MVDVLSPAETAEDICFFSDSSTSNNLGFGCILQDHWIKGFWGKEFMAAQNPSIEFLELFALCAGVFTWQDHPDLLNCRVVVFCDNMAVVHMINNLMSGCANCMGLIRLLTLNNLKFNRRISTKFVSTKDNFLADALSRDQMLRFRRLGPHMRCEPDTICERIWPVSKVWKLHC